MSARPFIGASLFGSVPGVWGLGQSRRLAVPLWGAPPFGIQFAPAVVCASACLLLDPTMSPGIILMLWGYSLFQTLVGVRLLRWLLAEPWSTAHWSYTFGIASSAACGCKLALTCCAPAQAISVVTFLLANVVIGFLLLRAMLDIAKSARSN